MNEQNRKDYKNSGLHPHMKLSPQACVTEECGREAKARGYCSTCYYRLRRTGALDISVPPQRWRHRLSEIAAETRTGTCSTCGPNSKLVKRGAKYGHGWRCYEDTRKRSKQWKAERRKHLRETYLKSACQICGRTEKLCWDHDHKTGKFRGTLCDICNTGIGCFRDDPRLLIQAVEYLKQAKHNEELASPEVLKRRLISP